MSDAKITNPDVYKMRIAAMRACLVSIEHWIDQEGGIAREPYDALERVYDDLLALTDHIANGYPLVRAR